MSAEQLKIIFEGGTLDIEFVVGQIQLILLRHTVAVADFILDGKATNLSSVLPMLQQSGRKNFELTGHGFEFLFGPVANHHLDFLRIKSTVASSITWDEWVAPFIANPHFVMAWVADSECEHWQNAEDPLQYTSAGKSYAHLPLKSNGLPYPLEQQVIDTSSNPGRWIFRDGYVEAIGALMWLGPPFWKLTQADRERIESVPWLRVSHATPSVTKIQAAEHSFTTAEGMNAELQAKLRSLLFPAQIPSPLMRN